MMMEMIVAIGVLTTATVPIAFSFVSETRLCRQYYFRAVAMEAVDGEMRSWLPANGNLRQRERIRTRSPRRRRRTCRRARSR